MRIQVEKSILAIVTPDRQAVAPGGAPVFYAATRADAERKAQLMARILDAMVHDVGDETFILVRH